MQKKTHTGLQSSGTDTQSRQSFTHAQIEPPANGNPECQACGETITEGDPVTVYFSRPAGHSSYTIGQCRCSDHDDDLTALFTLAVRELIVDGRIGHYRQRDTQQTSAVLLAPSVRLISAPDTKSGRVGSNHGTSQPDSHRQGRDTDYLSDSPSATDSCQLSPSHPHRDGSSAPVEPTPVERCDDG